MRLKGVKGFIQQTFRSVIIYRMLTVLILGIVILHEESYTAPARGSSILEEEELKSGANEGEKDKDPFNVLIFFGGGMGHFYERSSDYSYDEVYINGERIEESTYTLKEDLTATGVDGLRTLGGSITNNATITLESNGVTYSGMRIDGGEEGWGIGLNNGVITGVGYGITVTEGVAINKGTVSTTVDGGMIASGSIAIAIGDEEVMGGKSTVINYGTVSNTGDEGVSAYGDGGMVALGMGSTAINHGRIENEGWDGMYAINGGIVINEVSGTVANKDSYGMDAEGNGSMAINYGEISNTGDSGMYAIDGGIVINKVGGIISNKGDVGMYADFGGTAENYGIVSNGGEDGSSFGMLAEGGGTVTNYGTISNAGTLGMWANGYTDDLGSEAINYGTVSNEGEEGISATGEKTIARNYGTISNEGNFGMKASSDGTIINQRGGTIKNDGDYGMQGSFTGGGTTVENYGIVKNTGHNGITISRDNAIASNWGTVSNEKDYGMSADNGGTATNKEGGIVSNKGDYGMSVWGDESTAENYGIIKNLGNKGMEAINGGVARNFGTIFNGRDYGMYAEDGGTVINEKGGIISNGGNFGIANGNGSGQIAENYGRVSNNGDYGMYVGRSFGDGSKATNYGTVSNLGNYGMYADGSYGTLINEVGATVSNTGDYGMYADTTMASFGSTATNKGTISNSGNYGMYADGNRSTITNEPGGIIKNNGNYRMHAEIDSVAENKGVLDTGFIGTSLENGYKVMASNGGTITNEGTIDVNHDYGIGIYVENGASAINEGTINLNASNGVGIYSTGDATTVVNNGTINLGIGSNNRDIVLNGATIVNSGQVVTSGALNLGETGDGKFIMSEGGTVEADSVTGDFYASGSLARGSYENEYTTSRTIKADTINGKVISNSAMFDAELTEQDSNGYYDILLERKSFNNLMTNPDLARVLEIGYTDNGEVARGRYFDALKLVTTADELNNVGESSYGMDYYPTIGKQTFDMIRDNNNVIANNLIIGGRNRKVGEMTAIGGVNYSKLEEESYENVSGYDLELYSVHLGAEKQVKENTRVGGIATIGKSKAEYNDMNASREDVYCQGSAYLVHESNGLKLALTIFVGVTDTELERNLDISYIYGKQEDNIENYYGGMSSMLSKRFYMGRSYIEPRAEFNITHVRQGDISEVGDYPLEIDGVNSTSVETGIGVALGRDIFLFNRHKLNIEGSVTAYTELGDPYSDLDSKFNILSDQEVKINGYDANDYYGDAALRLSFETPKLLTLYTEATYRMVYEENEDEESSWEKNNWKVNAGFKFLF